MLFRLRGDSVCKGAGRKNLRRIRFRFWKFGKCDIGCELVALAANRYDQPAVFRISRQSLPQMRNVLRQVSLFDKGVPPDRFEQFVLCDQPVGVLSEEKQDVEGFRGDWDRRFVAAKCASFGVEHIRSEAVQVVHDKADRSFTPTLPSSSSFFSDSLRTSQKPFLQNASSSE